MISRTFVFAAACGTAVGASAGEAYQGIGTTGLEAGYGVKLADTYGVRLDVSFLSYKQRLSTGDVDYDAKLKFANAGLYGDWFLSGSFRISGGALIGSRTLEGHGQSSGGTVNGVAYPAAAGGLRLEAKFPTVAPYLGIGWGHRQSNSGLGFYADLGAAYGRPKVQITSSPALVAAVGQANIDDEQRMAQDKADSLKFYPVAKIGVSYTF